MDSSSQLVKEAGQGSLEAFSQLVRRHQARVRAFLSQYISQWDQVDDLAQDAFLAAYQSLKNFSGDSPFETWLLGIARNKLLMHLRDLRQQHLRQDDAWSAYVTQCWTARLEADPVIHNAGTPDREIEALRSCLGSLAPASARMIKDYYFNGRRIVDMAREEGKGERALGMMLLRIRQALQRCMRSKVAPAGVQL